MEPLPPFRDRQKTPPHVRVGERATPTGTLREVTCKTCRNTSEKAINVWAVAALCKRVPKHGSEDGTVQQINVYTTLQNASKGGAEVEMCQVIPTASGGALVGRARF